MAIATQPIGVPTHIAYGVRVELVTMRQPRSLRVRSLKALDNISWLTTEQLEKLAAALTVTRHEKRHTIFSDKSLPDTAYILLSGVARISCDKRKGPRAMAIILAPGLIPAFPSAVAGITYNFRCEAVTTCQSTHPLICTGLFKDGCYAALSASIEGASSPR